MYLFTRTVRVKNAAAMAAAIRFANEVCAHVNKAYPVKMRFGVEVFGHTRIDWFMDLDSVDQSLAMNQKILMDPNYESRWAKAKTCGSKAV